jgi:hypothetical protein
MATPSYLTVGFQVNACPFCHKFDQLSGGYRTALRLGVGCNRCEVYMTQILPDEMTDETKDMTWEQFERHVMAQVVDRWNDRDGMK